MPLEFFHIFSYTLIKEILPHMTQLGSGWQNVERHLETDRTNEGTGVSKHYDDVIMGAMASRITSLTIAYSTA